MRDFPIVSMSCSVPASHRNATLRVGRYSPSWVAALSCQAVSMRT
jgi:hypothetical protein